MKISIKHVSAANNSVAKAIEAKCAESDTHASGVIGSSFSTSGPGSGWTKEHDVSDYAKRALSGEYGAAAYIDSEDGREATETEVIYFVDVYASGCEAELRGPFSTLQEAQDACDGKVAASVNADKDIVAKLKSKHEVAESPSVELIEAWSLSEESEDFCAIYAVGGDIVWTQSSVIILDLPTLEEALEDPEAFAAMCKAAETHDSGEDFADLAAKVAA